MLEANRDECGVTDNRFGGYRWFEVPNCCFRKMWSLLFYLNSLGLLLLYQPNAMVL